MLVTARTCRIAALLVMAGVVTGRCAFPAPVPPQSNRESGKAHSNQSERDNKKKKPGSAQATFVCDNGESRKAQHSNELTIRPAYWRPFVPPRPVRFFCGNSQTQVCLPPIVRLWTPFLPHAPPAPRCA